MVPFVYGMFFGPINIPFDLLKQVQFNIKLSPDVTSTECRVLLQGIAPILSKTKIWQAQLKYTYYLNTTIITTL